MVRVAALLLISVASLVAGMGLVLEHPGPSWLLGVALVGWLAWMAVRPGDGLTLLTAVLPVASLAPWTGWIVVDESDILLLGTLAGAYARSAYAVARGADVAWPTQRATMVLLGLAALTLLGVVRGLTDAGDLHLALHHDQAAPGNTLRVAKSAIYAVLFAPLVLALWRANPSALLRRLRSGMWAGCALLCVLVIRERVAYVGWLDWSLPFRTTGWFWEMHVGGAAIDAYVAMGTPFVVWALWAARTWPRWLMAAGLAATWTYVVLTTYARGAYGGAGVALLVLAFLLPWSAHGRIAAVLRVGLGGCGLSILAWLAIDAAGTAGAIATLALALAGLALAVFRRWSGGSASQPAGGWRTWAAAALGLFLVVEAATIVGPDSFMWKRFGVSTRDGVSRFEHWSRGLSMLNDPVRWSIGLGLGRLPVHYDRGWRQEQFSGRAQPASDAYGQRWATIQGPRTVERLGSLYGLTQRVGTADAYRVGLDLRAQRPVELLVRVCEAHLLYERTCQAGFIRFDPEVSGRAWHRLEFDLVGDPLTPGWRWAPRDAVLTLSVVNAGGQADIDRVALSSHGQVLALRNPEFTEGFAGWFPVAQYHFLPWHVDSLVLELLIERGVLGLTAFVALVGFAFWPVRRDRAVREPDLAFVVAALLGGLSVGLVSSVLDVPRVALLMLLLLTVLIAARSAGSVSRPGSQAPESQTGAGDHGRIVK